MNQLPPEEPLQEHNQQKNVMPDQKPTLMSIFANSKIIESTHLLT